MLLNNIFEQKTCCITTHFSVANPWLVLIHVLVCVCGFVGLSSTESPTSTYGTGSMRSLTDTTSGGLVQTEGGTHRQDIRGAAWHHKDLWSPGEFKMNSVQIKFCQGQLSLNVSLFTTTITIFIVYKLVTQNQLACSHYAPSQHGSSSEGPALVYNVNCCLSFQQEHDVNIKHCTAALRALPVYLREEDPQFFKTWNVSIQCIYRTVGINEVILRAFLGCLAFLP